MFEKYIKVERGKRGKQYDKKYITIGKKGNFIYISAKAMEAYKEIKDPHIIMGYDKEKNRIGLKIVEGDEQHITLAFIRRAPKHPAEVSKGTGVISARGFLKKFKLEAYTNKRFELFYEEDSELPLVAYLDKELEK